MRNAGLAAAAAILLAAAVTAYAPAKRDEDPWSEEALRARYPDPDAGAADTDFGENGQCRDCHEPRVKSLIASAHKTLANARKSGTRGCQECHGPAAQHLDDSDVPLRNPANAPDYLSGAPPVPADEKPAEGKAGGSEPPAEKPSVQRGAPVEVTVAAMNAVCLRCHMAVLKDAPTEHSRHREWIGRAHAPATERSCVSCHRVHVDASTPAF